MVRRAVLPFVAALAFVASLALPGAAASHRGEPPAAGPGGADSFAAPVEEGGLGVSVHPGALPRPPRLWFLGAAGALLVVAGVVGTSLLHRNGSPFDPVLQAPGAGLRLPRRGVPSAEEARAAGAALGRRSAAATLAEVAGDAEAAGIGSGISVRREGRRVLVSIEDPAAAGEGRRGRLAGRAFARGYFEAAVEGVLGRRIPLTPGGGTSGGDPWAFSGRVPE